jgi:hypothetical protein
MIVRSGIQFFDKRSLDDGVQTETSSKDELQLMS